MQQVKITSFLNLTIEMKNLARFVTVIFAVITLSVSLSHFFELPGKINLPKENYQVVQGIYKGWAWLGIFEVGTIIFTLALTIAERRKKWGFIFLLTATILFTASIAVFFIYTKPANTATINWTQLPPNWELLRGQWEYSHAARAILNLTGVCFLILAILKKKIYYGYK
jgi:Domain of unknown function (DUF1772)